MSSVNGINGSVSARKTNGAGTLLPPAARFKTALQKYLGRSWTSRTKSLIAELTAAFRDLPNDNPILFEAGQALIKIVPTHKDYIALLGPDRILRKVDNAKVGQCLRLANAEEAALSPAPAAVALAGGGAPLSCNEIAPVEPPAEPPAALAQSDAVNAIFELVVAGLNENVIGPLRQSKAEFETRHDTLAAEKNRLQDEILRLESIMGGARLQIVRFNSQKDSALQKLQADFDAVKDRIDAEMTPIAADLMKSSAEVVAVDEAGLTAVGETARQLQRSILVEDKYRAWLQATNEKLEKLSGQLAAAQTALDTSQAEVREQNAAAVAEQERIIAENRSLLDDTRNLLQACADNIASNANDSAALEAAIQALPDQIAPFIRELRDCVI
ncbi:MAG: hypothetical protein QME05_03365 [Candidatus Margulisbacteria bacterium]|nr:hypothetical protein [Candidatus Margulisiibacteriota bacterium]